MYKGIAIIVKVAIPALGDSSQRPPSNWGIEELGAFLTVLTDN